jgi:general secretion pathway protein A
MQDQQGQKFYAALTKLDDSSATFAVGTETKTVALAALALQWSGDYTLLWRKPPVVNKPLLRW